jgi:hypothetical protein
VASPGAGVQLEDLGEILACADKRPDHLDPAEHRLEDRQREHVVLGQADQDQTSCRSERSERMESGFGVAAVHHGVRTAQLLHLFDDIFP